jgi:thiamine biosynthesis lipoprotein
MVLIAEKLFRAIEQIPLRGVGGYYNVSFNAMGTACEILFSARSPAAANAFKQTAFRWIAEFEAKYSRFIDTSLISEINRSAGKQGVEIDEATNELLSLCDWYHWMTGGIFDPTSLPLLLLWDSRKTPPDIPSPACIEQARASVGWSKVQRVGGKVILPEPGMKLDIGGIGKEYAVDQVMERALASGIENILVDFGRDLRMHGEPPEKGPWRIGLENPDAPGQCWCGIARSNGAVCTSGDYARFIEVDGRRYGHIIDPRSGYPVHNDCRSATVLAPTCTEAGMLATTSFILGAEPGLEMLSKNFAAEGCIWTSQGVHETRRFREYVISKK